VVYLPVITGRICGSSSPPGTGELPLTSPVGSSGCVLLQEIPRGQDIKTMKYVIHVSIIMPQTSLENMETDVNFSYFH